MSFPLRMSAKIPFTGKHYNKLVYQVLEEDPSYIKWMIQHTDSTPSMEVVVLLEAKGHGVKIIDPKLLISDYKMHRKKTNRKPKKNRNY